MDHEALNDMKASELKIMCKGMGLRVSGSKSELINRIIEASEPARKEESVPSMDQAIDALLDRHDKSTKEKKTETKTHEIMDAEIVEDTEVKSDESEFEILLLDDDTEEEKPLRELVENKTQEFSEKLEEEKIRTSASRKPSESSETKNKIGNKVTITRMQLAAGLTVALLLSASLWIVLQRDSSFTVQPVRYGDSIQFSIQQSTISVEGDDMVSIVRDSLSPSSFDQVCSEVDVEISGTGSMSVEEGSDQDTIFPSDLDHRGAFSVNDAYGRASLAVKQVVNHDLKVDLQGKTWRDNGVECSNAGWSYPDNQILMQTDSYRHISDKSVIRTETTASFSDSDGESTELEATTFGSSLLPGLGAIAPLLSVPLLPMDLQDFFENEVLEEGAASDEGSTWEWSVKQERNDPIHGYVYPISISHKEIEHCLGYITLDILVNPQIPWPVQQTANIRLDKSLSKSDCNVFASAISDATLPEGRLDIRMDMTVTSAEKGNTAVNWYDEYDSKPSPGDDRPTSAGKRDWASHMPDESDSRLNIEETVACMTATYPTSDASVAVDSGGYFWKANHLLGDMKWNLSWVDTQDSSGWIHLSMDGQECSIIESGQYQDGEVSWDKTSVPSTLTLDYLGNRLLAQGRYSQVEQVLFEENAAKTNMLGYRVLSGEADDLSDLLSSDLSTGIVTVVASSEWSQSNRDYSFNAVMDATTARVGGWIQISTASD